MSQIQAQRRGNLGFNRSSLSPQKYEKQSEKLNKRIIWKPRLTFKYWELQKSKIPLILKNLDYERVAV